MGGRDSQTKGSVDLGQKLIDAYQALQAKRDDNDGQGLSFEEVKDILGISEKATRQTIRGLILTGCIEVRKVHAVNICGDRFKQPQYFVTGANHD